jgi:hypothetical protein
VTNYQFIPKFFLTAAFDYRIMKVLGQSERAAFLFHCISLYGKPQGRYPGYPLRFMIADRNGRIAEAMRPFVIWPNGV